MNRRPASVSLRLGHQVGNQLAGRRALRFGQTGQEIAGQGEGQAVGGIGEPVHEPLQGMVAGFVLGGFPMRIDVDNHPPHPQLS